MLRARCYKLPIFSTSKPFSRFVHSNDLSKNAKQSRISIFPSHTPTNIGPSISKRGEERQKSPLKVGDQLHGYKVLQISDIPERNLTAYRLEHLKTGAKHLHIDCADTNNAFCVTFKTIPRDSTGVAHILEHTTLCGSKKYPVRDPFFNMIKRSLNTYMNAWTASDYTSYPFSTQNEADYSNLLSVYLDATFFPKLEKIDFLQEGHRLEFEKPDDPSSPLTFKGVVYNEMKGAMSDGSSVFSHRLVEQLYPNSTYSFNSGGEPSDIPNLTYDQLKEFHQVHYHPSNACFITYGDLPLEGHLKYINENALSQFEKIDPKTEVPLIDRFTEPKRIEMTCPPPPMDNDPEKHSKVNVAVVTSPVNDIYESFYLSMLSTLLLNGPNSPIYKALIDSNIGSSYAPSTGHDSWARENLFGIGLQGLKKEDIPKVEQIIRDTLEQSIKEGFDKTRIEGVIHQIEILQKNVTTNFGLQIISGVTHTWIHGGDPIEMLRINQYIENLRRNLAKGPFFERMIKKYLIDNPHKLTLVMHPDPEYMDKQEKLEKEKLKEFQNNLTNSTKQEIIALANELKLRQDQKQDVSCLPTVKLADISRTEEKVETFKKNIANIPVTWCPQPTNGIVYFRGLLPMPDIPQHLLHYIPLFTSVLTHMGTAKKNHRELAQQIELYTGGITTNNSLMVHHSDLNQLNGYLQFFTFALERNIQPMFELLSEVMTSPNFTDTNLLKTIISQRAANLQDSLIDNGHSYAQIYASSPFRRSTVLHEMWDGVSQVEFATQLAMQEDLNETVSKLQELAHLFLSNSMLRCMVTAEEKMFEKLDNHVSKFINELPSKKHETNIGDKQESSPLSKTFITIPGQVNYVAASTSSVPYTHEDSARLQLLARLLSRNYLHCEIREKGGAYGAGALLQSGMLEFYSYRDPNVVRTVESIQKSIDWIRKREFTDQDLEEAKLTVFASMDAPVAPSAKGSLEFTAGITAEMRQRRRNQLFEIAREELVQVAEKYLHPNNQLSIAVLGNEKGQQEIKHDPTWQVK